MPRLSSVAAADSAASRLVTPSRTVTSSVSALRISGNASAASRMGEVSKTTWSAIPRSSSTIFSTVPDWKMSPGLTGIEPWRTMRSCPPGGKPVPPDAQRAAAVAPIAGSMPVRG